MKTTTDITPALRDLLLLSDVKVSLATIRGWTEKQQRKAEDWAVASHLRASDNPVKVPKRPAFLPKA